VPAGHAEHAALFCSLEKVPAAQVTHETPSK
jgi:hypothetical protein